MRHQLTTETIEALANSLRLFLRQNDLWHDTLILFNQIAYTSRDDSIVLLEERADPHAYFEHVAEPHILSMCFEGPLYDLINHRGGALLDAFNQIFEAYDVYYELGNTWNLTCVQNPCRS